jgi:hypothetical protein
MTRRSMYRAESPNHSLRLYGPQRLHALVGHRLQVFYPADAVPLPHTIPPSFPVRALA